MANLENIQINIAVKKEEIKGKRYIALKYDLTARERVRHLKELDILYRGLLDLLASEKVAINNILPWNSQFNKGEKQHGKG